MVPGFLATRGLTQFRSASLGAECHQEFESCVNVWFRDSHQYLFQYSFQHGRQLCSTTLSPRVHACVQDLVTGGRWWWWWWRKRCEGVVGLRCGAQVVCRAWIGVTCDVMGMPQTRARASARAPARARARERAKRRRRERARARANALDEAAPRASARWGASAAAAA